MSAITAGETRLVHATSGRVRVYCPVLSGVNQRRIENCLRSQPGIDSVQANPDTGNILIRYSAAQISSAQVLDAVSSLNASTLEISEAGQSRLLSAAPAAPPAVQEREGQGRRARIAVRGLDRDPETARRVVERLQRLPSVKAKANALTGRVLVEWDSCYLDLEDLISEVADVELPDVPGEDRPAHPLDPAPLQQSAARLTASSLGLGLLAVQRFTAQSQPLVGGSVLPYLGGVIHVVQAFPPLRNGLRTLLGRNAATLALSLPDIILASLTGSPLALTLRRRNVAAAADGSGGPTCRVAPL